MLLIAIFALFFVAGPAGFRLLSGGPATGHKIRKLAILMALAAASAVALRYTVPQGAMNEVYLSAGIILFIWLSWIAAMALGAQVLRRADPSPAMRRWTRIGGMLCTTVPWFGLAAADMVGI